MILPTKHIPMHKSLLGVGAQLLSILSQPQTVTGLWNNVRHQTEVATFDRFVLTLDLLFIIGAIRIEEGLLKRNL